MAFKESQSFHIKKSRRLKMFKKAVGAGALTLIIAGGTATYASANELTEPIQQDGKISVDGSVEGIGGTTTDGGNGEFFIDPSESSSGDSSVENEAYFPDDNYYYIDANTTYKDLETEFLGLVITLTDKDGNELSLTADDTIPEDSTLTMRIGDRVVNVLVIKHKEVKPDPIIEDEDSDGVYEIIVTGEFTYKDAIEYFTDMGVDGFGFYDETGETIGVGYEISSVTIIPEGTTIVTSLTDEEGNNVEEHFIVVYDETEEEVPTDVEPVETEPIDEPSVDESEDKQPTEEPPSDESPDEESDSGEQTDGESTDDEQSIEEPDEDERTDDDKASDEQSSENPIKDGDEGPSDVEDEEQSDNEEEPEDTTDEGSKPSNGEDNSNEGREKPTDGGSESDKDEDKPTDGGSKPDDKVTDNTPQVKNILVKSTMTLYELRNTFSGKTITVTDSKWDLMILTEDEVIPEGAIVTVRDDSTEEYYKIVYKDKDISNGKSPDNETPTLKNLVISEDMTVSELRSSFSGKTVTITDSNYSLLILKDDDTLTKNSIVIVEYNDTKEYYKIDIKTVSAKDKYKDVDEFELEILKGTTREEIDEYFDGEDIVYRNSKGTKLKLDKDDKVPEGTIIEILDRSGDVDEIYEIVYDNLTVKLYDGQTAKEAINFLSSQSKYKKADIEIIDDDGDELDDDDEISKNDYVRIDGLKYEIKVSKAPSYSIDITSSMTVKDVVNKLKKKGATTVKVLDTNDKELSNSETLKKGYTLVIDGVEYDIEDIDSDYKEEVYYDGGMTVLKPTDDKSENNSDNDIVSEIKDKSNQVKDNVKDSLTDTDKAYEKLEEINKMIKDLKNKKSVTDEDIAEILGGISAVVVKYKEEGKYSEVPELIATTVKASDKILADDIMEEIIRDSVLTSQDITKIKDTLKNDKIETKVLDNLYDSYVASEDKMKDMTQKTVELKKQIKYEQVRINIVNTALELAKGKVHGEVIAEFVGDNLMASKSIQRVIDAFESNGYDTSYLESLLEKVKVHEDIRNNTKNSLTGETDEVVVETLVETIKDFKDSDIHYLSVQGLIRDNVTDSSVLEDIIVKLENYGYETKELEELLSEI